MFVRPLLGIELNYRVGNWIDREPKNKYKSFYSPHHDRLYLKENNYWRVYRSDNPRIIMRTGNGRYTRDDDTYDELPLHAKKVATYERISQQAVRLKCFKR